MHMKNPNHYSFLLFLSAIIISGLLYFVLCVLAEFKKSQKNDLRLDGKLCYKPRSSAFGLGFGALICLCFAQVIGNLFICKKFKSKQQNRGCKATKPSLSCILLIFSWISFGVAVILISVATSMSQRQAFGEGWLHGECYLVRDGVYIGSGFLGLLALGLTIGLGAINVRQIQAEEKRKVRSCTSRSVTQM